MVGMTIQAFAARFGVALLLGALIGLEREWRQRMAGTRTNALVAGGAAAFAMSGGLILGDTTAEARIVSYVVSGVGFLGAGVIFKESAQIRGRNTAATIWCSAAVGVITALGPAQYAVLILAGVLLPNTALRPLAINFILPYRIKVPRKCLITWNSSAVRRTNPGCTPCFCKPSAGCHSFFMHCGARIEDRV